MGSARILVADDDQGVLQSLSGVLRDSGFDVSAADGRESLFRELDWAAPVCSVDMVARYGGEEFVVVPPQTVLQGAEAFAERTRELVEKSPFAEEYGGVRITASIGVAAFRAPDVNSVDDLFARADEALYRAKADGRNKVCT